MRYEDGSRMCWLLLGSLYFLEVISHAEWLEARRRVNELE
jgi:hypothetical protein